MFWVISKRSSALLVGCIYPEFLALGELAPNYKWQPWHPVNLNCRTASQIVVSPLFIHQNALWLKKKKIKLVLNLLVMWSVFCVYFAGRKASDSDSVMSQGVTLMAFLHCESGESARWDRPPPDVNRTSNGIGGFRPFSWVTRLRHPPVTRPHGSSRKILHPSYRSNSRTMLSSNATAARSRVISRPRVKNVRIKYRTSFFGFSSCPRKISC